MATLKELAGLTGGQVVGDPSREISRLAAIEQAGPGDITFVAHAKFLPRLADCKASAVIVAPGMEASGFDLIVCRNPYLAFAKVLTRLHVKRPEPAGVMAGAWVQPSAILGAEITIHPGCVVGHQVRIGRGTILYPGVVLYDGVEVGEDCTLHAGVVVREGCRIGHRVILQPSAVIGADGFGFAPDGEGYFKIPQVGIVVIEDDVEIGAGTCVDRAALGVTRIGKGVKLDNLIQIAHNVEVGDNTVMASQVGIAGSSKVGKHCTFGGQTAISGHLQVGDNVVLGGRSGVTGNVESNQMVSGLPVIPHKDWLRASMSFAKLPEIRKDVNRLKQQLAELELLLKEKCCNED